VSNTELTMMNCPNCGRMERELVVLRTTLAGLFGVVRRLASTIETVEFEARELIGADKLVAVRRYLAQADVAMRDIQTDLSIFGGFDDDGSGSGDGTTGSNS